MQGGVVVVVVVVVGDAACRVVAVLVGGLVGTVGGGTGEVRVEATLLTAGLSTLTS
jgi:hypothetical protein